MNTQSGRLIEDDGSVDGSVDGFVGGLVGTDYASVARSLVAGNDPSLLNQFRVVAVPDNDSLENYTDDAIVTVVDGDGVTFVLFGGTRNNEESWCPVSVNEDDQLEKSVEDSQLIAAALSRYVNNKRRRGKQTLIRGFALVYSEKFYAKASGIATKLYASNNLFRRLKATQTRAVGVTPYDWETHGLYSRLVKAADSEDDNDDDDDNNNNNNGDILDENDLLDDPMAAFEKIAGSLEIDEETEPYIDEMRGIITNVISYMQHVADNHEVVLEELQGLRDRDNSVWNLTQRIQTLSARDDAKRRKIIRLEGLLLSIAKNHPFSESLWDSIFESLGLEEDAELKKQLLRQIITERPQMTQGALAPSLPDLSNQDESVDGVRKRGHVRTGRGVPNSA